MKLSFIILVLILSILSWTKADDIGDFEIEGMSIGDSLLKYMNEKIIKKEINNKDITMYYENKYVSISTWDIRHKFKTYDDVGVVFNPQDKKYTIVSLEGTLYFKSPKIIKCYKKQNQIVNEIKNSLSISFEEDTWFVDKKNLESDENSIKYIDLNLKNHFENGAIRIICYDIKRDDNILYVVLDSPEFLKYIESR